MLSLMKSNKMDRRSALVMNAFIAVFIANILVFFWLGIASFQDPVVVLSQQEIRDTPHACPGDSIPYSFTIGVDKTASVNLYYRLTDSFGNSDLVRTETFIFDSSSTVVFNREWVIPLERADHSLWIEGVYVLRIQAIADPGGRESNLLYLPFEINPECFDD